MLAFERQSRRGSNRIEIEPQALIVAGWTGRDEAALRHHIEELAAIGVPRPSSVPVFYRAATANLTQSSRLQVLGPAPLFRLKDLNRSRLVVKAEDRPAAVAAVGAAVGEVAADRKLRPVRLTVDVDPQ